MVEPSTTTGTSLSRLLRSVTRARRVQPQIGSLHAQLLRVRGSRIWRFVGAQPVLVLTTTSRFSGKAQSTVLTYLRYGDRYVVGAVRLGPEHEPGWCLNLRVAPLARVEADGQRLVVRAREASLEEAIGLRARFVEQLPQAGHKLARRHIPLIVLEPVRSLR